MSAPLISSTRYHAALREHDHAELRCLWCDAPIMDMARARVWFNEDGEFRYASHLECDEARRADEGEVPF